MKNCLLGKRDRTIMALGCGMGSHQVLKTMHKLFCKGDTKSDTELYTSLILLKVNHQINAGLVVVAGKR